MLKAVLFKPIPVNTLNQVLASHKFEIQHDLLVASWPSYVRSESAEFFASILLLFRLIRENNIRKLLLDSGTPEGGTLTEEVITFIEQEVMHCCPMQKIALLESVDYLWDNNLAQIINYLKMSLELNLEFRMFLSKEAAINWLTEA